MKKIILILVIGALAIAAYLFWPKAEPIQPNEQDSQPEVAVTYTNSSEDNIVVNTPWTNGEVNSQFTITGEARGNWYFEASFPVTVFDSEGNILVQLPVQAQGDWMTTDFVPFSVAIDLDDYVGNIRVVLDKDNPSGLPEHDASVEMLLTVKAEEDAGANMEASVETSADVDLEGTVTDDAAE